MIYTAHSIWFSQLEFILPQMNKTVWQSAYSREKQTQGHFSHHTALTLYSTLPEGIQSLAFSYIISKLIWCVKWNITHLPKAFSLDPSARLTCNGKIRQWLTHWSLGDAVIFKTQIKNWYFEHFLWNCPQMNANKTSLMITQHWFRQWLDTVRQQATTWTHVGPDQRQMVSLGLHDLKGIVLW